MVNQPDSIGQGVEEGASLVALASHNTRNGFRLGRRGDEAGASSSSGNTGSSQLGSHAACAPLRLPACATGVHLHHTMPWALPHNALPHNALCPATQCPVPCRTMPCGLLGMHLPVFVC